LTIALHCSARQISLFVFSERKLYKKREKKINQYFHLPIHESLLDELQHPAQGKKV